MINVTFGAAGATDFNGLNFAFQALIGADFKVTLAEDKIRLYSSKNDYVELQGEFKTDLESGDYRDYVTSVTGFKVVDHGKVAYQISGLDIGADELASLKAFSKYFSDSEYKIKGSNAANELYSGNGADKLIGLDGNDFLFSGRGEDELLGGKGNDAFEAGKGADTIIDKIGVDTLIFHKGDGVDTVSGFSLLGKAHDKIDLSEFYSGDKDLRYKDLDISRHGKSDVSIDFGNGDEILLKGVSIKHVDAGDFQF